MWVQAELEKWSWKLARCTNRDGAPLEKDARTQKKTLKNSGYYPCTLNITAQSMIYTVFLLLVKFVLLLIMK